MDRNSNGFRDAAKWLTAETFWQSSNNKEVRGDIRKQEMEATVQQAVNVKQGHVTTIKQANSRKGEVSAEPDSAPTMTPMMKYMSLINVWMKTESPEEYVHRKS